MPFSPLFISAIILLYKTVTMKYVVYIVYIEIIDDNI